MESENTADLGIIHTAVKYHIVCPADGFLGRLEEDADNVIKLVLVRFEQEKKSECRGEVDIVSASVHNSDVL